MSTIVEFKSTLDRRRVSQIQESVDGEPQSRPLGIIHLNEDGEREIEPGPRFGDENVLLCSRCVLPAKVVCLLPWCALVSKVEALCLECTDEPAGYLMEVEQLRWRWNETLMHLAEKPGGGGSVQLLRWFGYSGLCKFLGFDNLAGWPIARGVITPELRALVLERDGHKCRRCPSTHRLTIDHVRPVSAGGFTTATNLQVLCQPCNSRKGGRRRKHAGGRPPGGGVRSPEVIPPTIADRAAEYLAGRPPTASGVVATAIGASRQHLNRVLTRDTRFHGVPGCGRGHPSNVELGVTQLTAGSLFSGIGGLELGLERAGIKVIWQAEIDPQASQVNMAERIAKRLVATHEASEEPS